MNEHESLRASNEAIRDQLHATLRDSQTPLSARQLAVKLGLSGTYVHGQMSVLIARGQVLRHPRRDRQGTTTFAAVPETLLALEQLPPLHTDAPLRSRTQEDE